jgi:hypothetical protein
MVAPLSTLLACTGSTAQRQQKLHLSNFAAKFNLRFFSLVPLNIRIFYEMFLFLCEELKRKVTSVLLCHSAAHRTVYVKVNNDI